MSKRPSKEQLKQEVNILNERLSEMTLYRDGLAEDYLDHKNIIARMESALYNIAKHNIQLPKMSHIQGDMYANAYHELKKIAQEALKGSYIISQEE